jgi:hypothetical protein
MVYTVRLRTVLPSGVCLVCLMACGINAKLYRTHDLTQPDCWPYVGYIYFVWFQCSSGWCGWSRSRFILCCRKDRGLRVTVSTMFEYPPVRNFKTLQIFRYCFVHPAGSHADNCYCVGKPWQGVPQCCKHVFPNTSVAYRGGGGVWGFKPSPKFRSFDKAEPNSLFSGNYIRNCLVFLFHHLIILKIAEFRTPTSQDVRKKGSKILKLPRFAIVLH